MQSRLLVLGGTQIYYDETHIHFKTSVGSSVSNCKIPYVTETWFQLVLTNGQVGQLGHDVGGVYINGKGTSESIIFPAELHNITIGIDVRKGDMLRLNNKYPSESSLGIIRIYNKILDKYEIYNNFLSGGRKYGILMETEASAVSNELYIELIPLKSNIQNNYWYSTEQIKIQELKNIKKIPINNYKMDNDLKQLESILKGLSMQPIKAKSAPNEVEGNIIILSRNPEMFLKNLQYPPDKITNQLMRKTQVDIKQSDYVSIFDNPFKIKLLVTYMRSTPKHFLALLKSNVLTNEQLTILNSALQSNDTILTDSTRTQQGGAFVMNGKINIPDIEYYDTALELLNNKVRNMTPPTYREPRSVGKYTPYLNDLAQSTTQIADIMSYNHNKQVLREKQNEKNQYMDTIQYLNDKITNAEQRTLQLEKLLKKQKSLMGLIVSKRSGKCIGAIDTKGDIKHCSHKEAQSPYNIIVNKDVHKINIASIIEQQKLSGDTADEVVKKVAATTHMNVLGQCINTTSKVVGLIVRQGHANHYIPTKTGEPLQDIPILAILTPSSPTSKPVEGCTRIKCKPGYVAQNINSVTDEDWLSKSTMESEERTPIRAYTEEDTKSISSEEGSPKGLMSTKAGSNLEPASIILHPNTSEEAQSKRSILSRVTSML